MTPIDLLLQHRSIRKYRDQAIAPSLLDRIMLAGTRASTTGNMQLYSLVITQNPERKKGLAPFHFNQSMITDAPVVLTICADVNRFSRWCEAREADAGYHNFAWFVNAAIDALLAAQNICLAAEAEGLGICYLGTTTYNAQEIGQYLGCPKGVIPITTLTIGYPAEEVELTDRLPLEAVVHHESYADYSPERINDLYAEKESLPLTKKLIEENQLPNLARVFTDKRYKKTDNEFFSQKFFDALLYAEFIQK